MDIGDLIFLLLIGFGFISSLLGGSKKKRKAPPRPARPPARPVEARGNAVSQMERLLEELQLRAGGERPRAAAGAAVEETEPDVVEVESYDDVYEEEEAPRPFPPVQHMPPGGFAEPSFPTLPQLPEQEYRVPLERPLPPSTRPVDAASHEKFHDKYVEPVRATRVRRGKGFRVRRHLRAETLKEAILLKEILGPPKGLR